VTFFFRITAALACCCCCWYVGIVAERAGENFWAGCCNAPIALLAVRSKIRGAFKIRVSVYFHRNLYYIIYCFSFKNIKGNLCYDQCISTCCCQCASMQAKRELDHHGVGGLGPAWLGNKP
jgi:hypothetical protein